MGGGDSPHNKKFEKGCGSKTHKPMNRRYLCFLRERVSCKGVINPPHNPFYWDEREAREKEVRARGSSPGRGLQERESIVEPPPLLPRVDTLLPKDWEGLALGVMGD